MRTKQEKNGTTWHPLHQLHDPFRKRDERLYTLLERKGDSPEVFLIFAKEMASARMEQNGIFGRFSPVREKAATKSHSFGGCIETIQSRVSCCYY